MSWQNIGHPDPSCSCGCAVATLAVTVTKYCSLGAATLAGVSVTATKGTTSITQTTDGSGVAHFSLNATGTWSLTFPTSPGAGYVASVGSGNPNPTIVAGANSTTIAPAIDVADCYDCFPSATCPDPVPGPFTIAGTIYWAGGPTSGTWTALCGSNTGKTAIFTLGTLSGTTFYAQFKNLGTSMQISVGTDPTLSFGTSTTTLSASAFTCGTITFPTQTPEPSPGFSGTVHN